MYYCNSCGIVSDGAFHERSYPTCNHCDSDILAKVEMPENKCCDNCDHPFSEECKGCVAIP